MGAYILLRSGPQFVFHLRADNGEPILQSERYVSKQGAENGIASCRVNSPFDARYEKKTSTANQPYFVLKAANGEVIGASEMYTTVQGRDNGINSCKVNGPTSPTHDKT